LLTLPPSVRIYFAVEPVNLRRGHDGLSGIVRGQWGMDLFAGNLFVFLGRRADRCKILFWDRGGLVTVVATCVANEVDPLAYLTDVLTRLDSTPADQVDTLLPQSWAVLAP
jgi:transposase